MTAETMKQRVKRFVTAAPVLWFLFVFNVAAAVVILCAVGGAHGAIAAISMGIVSIQAGFGLLRHYRRAASAPAAQSAPFTKVD
jgi:hypothetical protein